MRNAPDIAIVGAGLAGLLLARALLARGISTTVYEGQPSLHGPLPSEDGHVGDRERVTMGALGRALLRPFLPESLQSALVQADPLMILHPTGKRMLILPTDPDGPYAAFSIPRRALLESLHAGLEEERVHFGAELTGLTQRGGAATLSFRDGREIVADAVVAADGVRSTLRQLAWSAPLRYLGLRTIEGHVSSWGGSDLLQGTQTLTLGRGTSFWLRRTADGKGLSWTFSRQQRQDAHLSQGSSSLRGEVEQELASWQSSLSTVLAATPDEALYSRPLMGRTPPDPLFRDAVVLIGSASHGCSPFLVPPTDATIADAVELAEALSTASITTLGLRYRRFAEVAHPRGVTAATRAEWNGRLLHATSPWGRTVRDASLRMLGAGVERHNARLKAGPKSR